MSKSKPIEPVRCVCGRKPTFSFTNGICVVCKGDTVSHLWCWVGPVRKTRRGAIEAWNRVMERAQKKEVRRG